MVLMTNIKNKILDNDDKEDNERKDPKMSSIHDEILMINHHDVKIQTVKDGDKRSFNIEGENG